MFGQTEEGFLPALKNIVTGVIAEAGPLVSKYYELETAKEKAEAAVTSARIAELQRAQAISAAQIAPTTTRYPTYGAMTAGFDLESSWPILAIIGIGALLVFKGGRGAVPSGKSVRRRRR